MKAIHVDKEHIHGLTFRHHSHFIVNAYGAGGQKFNDNKETLRKIREESDRVSLALGIKPIDTERGAGRNIAYNEWEHKQRGTSWKEKIRLERLGAVKKYSIVFEKVA